MFGTTVLPVQVDFQSACVGMTHLNDEAASICSRALIPPPPPDALDSYAVKVISLVLGCVSIFPSLSFPFIYHSLSVPPLRLFIATINTKRFFRNGIFGSGSATCVLAPYVYILLCYRPYVFAAIGRPERTRKILHQKDVNGLGDNHTSVCV